MAAPALTRVSAGSSAEDAERVILDLCASLLGHDGNGAGLYSRTIGDVHHTPKCPYGMFLRPDDRLTHGSPCSARCRQVRAALDDAEHWLREHEQNALTRLAQLALFEAVS